MVAYAQALQYWAEKTDLPTGGKPCLLAESVKELWEEMKCYLSFSDKEVFKGVTPLEEMSTNPVKEAEPHSAAAMPAIAPEVQATTKAAGELTAERKPPKFPSWEKVLHPSWPVVAVKQIPVHQEVWGRPRLIGGGDEVSFLGGDYVYLLHCQGWDDWDHLLGYGNHLSLESGPQWPWTGDAGPGAHDRRHDRPHLRSSKIPAIGQ